MKVKYRFSYSGKFEGFKTFYKLSRLTSFISKIPDNELKNCHIFKIKDGLFYNGMFVRGKTKLLVKF